MQRNRKDYRVLMGLREIAGFYGNLKQGFDDIGIEATFLNLSYHPFGFTTKDNPKWANITNLLFSKISRRLQKGLLKAIWMGIICPILSFPIFIYTLFRYDVYIFGTFSSFLFFLDLPLLKLLKKKVIYVFHGSESRPFYLNGFQFQSTTKLGLYSALIVTAIQRFVIWYIELFAYKIVSIPPQSYFNNRSIINSNLVGIPSGKSERIYSIKARSETHLGRETHSVKILHAPSKPGPKGSEKIREYICQLKSQSYEIDYVEITGRPNHEVIEALCSCDFVIDQLYSDTPMAGFAAEAAALGKPALVGGYYSHMLTQILAEKDIPPTLFCQPDEVLQNIEAMVSSKELRESLGKKAEQFIHKSWSVTEVAKRYQMIIDNEYPSYWDYDPAQLDYIHGCGFAEDRLRSSLRKYLNEFGSVALFLGSKPNLRDRLIELCGKDVCLQDTVTPDI
ncbi:MAG: hypothetical protein HRU19_11645 [Pseudobacteriovorax sp.]|nr:hypothetical protein [Pseudobacteriovorax sp.]